MLQHERGRTGGEGPLNWQYITALQREIERLRHELHEVRNLLEVAVDCWESKSTATPQWYVKAVACVDGDTKDE